MLSSEAISTSGPVALANCWSHVRRHFYEIAQGGDAPIAEEALARIAALFSLERTIRGQAPEQRRSLRLDLLRSTVSRDTALCLMKEREGVSMADTTARGAGPAARAHHAGEAGPAPSRRRRHLASYGGQGNRELVSVGR